VPVAGGLFGRGEFVRNWCMSIRIESYETDNENRSMVQQAIESANTTPAINTDQGEKTVDSESAANVHADKASGEAEKSPADKAAEQAMEQVMLMKPDGNVRRGKGKTPAAAGSAQV
jgi:hypothetical protein